MKCSNCGKEIEYCSLTGCSGYFEEGQDIYCVEGEHFCDEECLHEYYVPEEAREAIVEEVKK